MYSLIIPTNEGDISITGYNINETTSNVDENNIENLANEWPNLNDTIRKEVIKNRFLGQADLLIGQDNYWTLVLEGVIKHPSERFGIINTKLGWTMGGRISNTSPITWQQEGSMKVDIYNCNIKQLQEPTEEDIRNSLVKLFEKEAETTDNKYTVDEEYAMETFLKNVKQEEDGRYTVSPLFKKDFVPIKNNYYHVKARYRSVRKMMGGDELKNKTYGEAIRKMIDNGEVEEVKENPIQSRNMDRHINYLPHHGVFKFDRVSTKCRVVFDASAQNSEGISLNSNLLPGPKRQLDIVHLLINFRLHPYTLVGDISRMFYCINLDEKHRNYYRFFWHDDHTQEPKIYRFKRLTMGSVDSPFLAINTVHHHVDQIIKTKPNLKEAAEFIKKYLYVDDLIGATDSVEQAINLRKEIQEIFAMMKMRITKWSSNSMTVLKTIPKADLYPYDEIQGKDITFGDPDIISQTAKCLGMTFCPKTDVFNYSSYEKLSQLEGKALKMTKRGISSIIPRIYDPTGLLQPFILKGKLILQQAWTYRNEGKPLGWDDKLPDEIKNRWLKWIAEIKEASKFEVNRYIFKGLKSIPDLSKLTLHGFCDAGENAWGVAIYIRFFNETTKHFQSHLIYSATRVAPTKIKLSIPRKELNGVVLVCEKLLYIANALGLTSEQIFAHTDSLVSMCWINKNKNNLKQYVSNRVNKIQQSKIKIFFTPGKLNPADLCSKPKPSKEYINNVFWTTGPSYLNQTDNTWIEVYKGENILQQKLPQEEEEIIQTEINETIKANIHLAKITPKESMEGINGVIHKHNNYYTILNITAQCFRAIFLMTKNLRNENRKMQLRKGFNLTRISSEISQNMTPEDQRKMHITPSIEELNFARNYLISEGQKLIYPEEYTLLEKGQQISEKSSLIKLNPMLKNGVLVMKGRLDNLHTMPEQMKNPIILPKDIKITKLIILQSHQATTHSGPALTQRNVRLKYWIPGGKSEIRKAIKLCGHNLCKYPYPEGQTQQIANLPVPRITPGNFRAISLDFAGPFNVKKCGICKHHKICQECQEKMSKKKTKKDKCNTQKAYICVFACHSSRAVHLELLMDRTTESFILAIRRMANRHSMPSIIHSDNASEIVKAKNHIKDLYDTLNTPSTHKELQNKYNIKWYHSTERSPQHNGVIERIVQTIKKPLYKVLNGRLFTENEMYTILTDCEAASNMRPLVTTSDNPEDNNLMPITPSHLIRGEAMNPLPTDIYAYEEKDKETETDAKERWKERKLVAAHYWTLWRESYLTTLNELTKNYCVKRNIKKGDVVLDLLERKTKLDWPIRIVHEALTGRRPGEKEERVRSVWLRHPIPASKVTDKGRHLTQHKYTKRGIEHISLLEEALEETTKPTS